MGDKPGQVAMFANPRGRCPLFVELCAGTAAVSLQLHAGPKARPPVSRMGSKRGYAHAILRALGLWAGQGQEDGTRYLWCEPDPGVRLLLHAYTDRALAQEAAAIILGWADEEPRALWERLRADGPARCPDSVEALDVARWAWVQGHGDSSKPPRLAAPYANPDGNPDGSWKAPPRDWLARRLDTTLTMPANITPDARTIDPREVARAARIITANRLISVDGNNWRNTGQGGSTFGGDGFCEPIGRLAESWAACPTAPAAVLPDAREVDPPQLPPGTVAYMDPPYVDTTPYAHLLPRADVVDMAKRWREAGATVCISEAEPIPALMADGWHAVEITDARKGQRRTFSKQQREWLTMSRPPCGQ